MIDLRWPGIEPGSTAWKAAMLTTIPPTQAQFFLELIYIYIYSKFKLLRGI